MKLSCLIIIPVLNSEDTILELANRLNNIGATDILFVDDGSSDSTPQLLESNGIPYLSHTENLGKGAALQSGMKYAVENGYDYMITMDADLQHPPELIPEFSKCKDEMTIVLGWRHDFFKMPLHRIFSNLSTSLLLSIRTNTIIRDSQCGFRLFPTRITKDISFSENGFQFESEFLIKVLLAGYKVQHIPIPTIYSDEKSAMRNVKDTLKFASMYFKSFFW